MKNSGKNIAIQIPLVRREHDQSEIEFLWRRDNKSKTPLFVVVKGVVFSPTHLRARDFDVQRNGESGLQKSARVILSAHDRFELYEEIDRRFEEIKGTEPDLDKYIVYRRISEHSIEWLGVFLGPRQVEGKLASYKSL